MVFYFRVLRWWNLERKERKASSLETKCSPTMLLESLDASQPPIFYAIPTKKHGHGLQGKSFESHHNYMFIHYGWLTTFLPSLLHIYANTLNYIFNYYLLPTLLPFFTFYCYKFLLIYGSIRTKKNGRLVT